MPRQARIIIPNAIHHILNRGNNKETVFFDEEDFKFFLHQARKYKQRFGLKIYHYCLMLNHFHFLLQSQSPQGLAKFMHALQLVHAQHLQRKYGKVGHIWQGRYKSPIIEKDDYLIQCAYYIEDNPRRAGLVGDLKDWPWSSYHFYAFGIFDALVDVNPEYFKLGLIPQERQERYRKYIMGAREEKWLRNIRQRLTQGILGNEKFVDEMVEKFKIKLVRVGQKGRPVKSS